MYSSKGEAPDATLLSNTMLKNLANENLFGNTSKKLYQAANAVFSSREICLQEMCWYLLGESTIEKSRDVIEINLYPSVTLPR